MYIQKATKNEIKLVAGMTQHLFEDEPSDTILSIEKAEDRLLSYINTGSEVFLFMEDDVIGYALVNLVRNPYYLVDFFICRNHRRGGKGTMAFQRLMEELNTEHIDLDVFCWNDRGRGFWESLGFKERAIIMRR